MKKTIKTYGASNTDEFVRKAKNIHGDKYDYSKLTYINARTKVCIICKKHGEFWQTPDNHLHKKGCTPCSLLTTALKRTKTTKQFIREANKAHNNKYDYSKTKYVNSHIKICIICKKHGEFWQTAAHHLNKRGCPKCGIKNSAKAKLKSQKDFIKKANMVHNNRYDYSKTKYMRYAKKICIICKKHGEFWQTAGNHLNGHGCPSCGLESSSKTQLGRYSKETKLQIDFIKEAKAIHGNRYDYSKTLYVNNNTKVCIICKKHGEFWQIPRSHICLTSECPKCRRITLKDGQSFTSNIEAYYYLKHIKPKYKRVQFDGYYGIGKLRYDFYLPQINTYVEVTSFCKGNRGWSGRRWSEYKKNIDKKKKYVKNVLGAKFKFIQFKLSTEELKFVKKHCIS